MIQQPFRLLHANYLSLDSRKILLPESTVFVAIKTDQRNGHDFVQGLYEKGVRNFILQAGEYDRSKLSKANIIEATDTLKALQNLAAYHRYHFETKPENSDFTVIGITGSNGKTIIKEWLAHLLSDTFSIAKSPGSFNSQVGVPLSILNIHSGNELGIFEAGISAPGEMVALKKIIEPNIGILTNLGQAHDAGFESPSQKLEEKLKLFANAQVLIYSSDNPLIVPEVKKLGAVNPILKVISWGRAEANTVSIVNIEKSNEASVILAQYQKEDVSITIPFNDSASVENAIHCLCTLFALELNPHDYLEKFKSLYSIAMRLEIKEGDNHCTLINDSYSNDLHSLGIALNFLAQQKQHSRNSVILSDILQSGQTPSELYSNIATLLHQKKIHRLFAIGPEFYFHQKEFAFLPSALFYKTVDDFIRQIPTLQFQHENILVKGARTFELEKVVRLLEKKVHQTQLIINLNAVVHNLKEYRKLLAPSVKVMGMVKAFSYGSGSHEIAAVLEYNNVDYVAVAYTDEGVALRKGGIALPIMVMNVEPSSFDALIHYDLEPEIFSFSILELFTTYLQHQGMSDYPVHLKIDTGMHRLGFSVNDIPLLCERLRKNNLLEVKTIFTHLVASEDSVQDDFTRRQLDSFSDVCSQIEKVLGYQVLKHAANTSGISRHKIAHLDMVRLGIGLYGIDNNLQMQRKLQPVTELKTTISQIKKVDKGDSVGYGRLAIMSRQGVIATVRLGYADGYPRSLGRGVGKMYINGNMVPTIGNICMDMTMLDITGINDITEGDEVEVFGEHVSLASTAKWADTIPYEIMTGISQRVKRIYFE